VPTGRRICCCVALAKTRFVLTADSTPVIQAGYGQTNLTVNDRGTLHQLTTTYRATAADRKIRASGAGGICSGDSGGPDYVVRAGRLVQIGVHVSGDCATSTISTDVRQFNSYIVSTGATPTFTL
jgi:secreted trypsin-like serine protease